MAGYRLQTANACREAELAVINQTISIVRFLHLSILLSVSAEDVAVRELGNLLRQAQADSGVLWGGSSPPGAKASRETRSLAWVLEELMCLQIVSGLNLTRDSSLGGSDSLLSVSGLMHALCIYLEQMEEVGSDECISLC